MKTQNTIFGTFTLAATAALTMGCSPSLKSLGSSDAASSTPLIVAGKYLRNEGTTYQSPSQGGLVANLYIQPRNLMSAPDTQNVGCGQQGNGALGIPAYLGQPSWVTQQLLFTDINVPARSFLDGFPLPDASGNVLPIKSYFAIDMKGNFHLGPNDQAGYYQFSVIADDAARIYTTSETPFDRLLVDNQKPAGNNGGCLEQTQAPHLGCSSVWGDQSAANIKTVYLKPGQALPLEVQYWQGPGGGLALNVFYRRVSDPSVASNVTEASCGKELGFSAGSASLNDLLTRWTVVGPANLLR